MLKRQSQGLIPRKAVMHVPGPSWADRSLYTPGCLHFGDLLLRKLTYSFWWMLGFVLKAKLFRVKSKLRSTERVVFSLRKSKPSGYNSGSVLLPRHSIHFMGSINWHCDGSCKRVFGVMLGGENMSSLLLAGKMFFGVIAEWKIVIIPVPLSALFFSSVWCIHFPKHANPWRYSQSLRWFPITRELHLINASLMHFRLLPHRALFIAHLGFDNMGPKNNWNTYL